jgi:nitrate/TMAO reductase-like tetraheme cytochrome c subunit
MRVFLAAICFFILIAQAPGARGNIFGNGLARKPGVERPVCLTCHDAQWMKPAYRQIVTEWRHSIHYRNGVSCNNCHGGDPDNAALAMSPQKGFVGVPTKLGVTNFCGKCHIDIMESFRASGHCLALQTTGKGPNCVTCHGAHNIHQANIDIINPKLCGRCHSYDRARIIKAALWQTEVKMKDLHESLRILKSGLIPATEEEKILFRTEESYRSLFHTVDVNMVKDKTAAFDLKLDALQVQVQKGFQELHFRRNFALLLMFIFLGLAITIFFLSRKSP